MAAGCASCPFLRAGKARGMLAKLVENYEMVTAAAKKSIFCKMERVNEFTFVHDDECCIGR